MDELRPYVKLRAAYDVENVSDGSALPFTSQEERRVVQVAHKLIHA